MRPRVAGRPSNKFVFHARSQERCQFLTSGNCKYEWSRMGKRARRSHDHRRYEDRLLLQEVYPISRHSRAKPNEVAVKARASANIIRQITVQSLFIYVRSPMTNQSLTANGNEPASRINLKRIGQANYAGDDASPHIGRCLSMSAQLVRGRAKLPSSFAHVWNWKMTPRCKSRWAAQSRRDTLGNSLISHMWRVIWY